MKMVLAVNDRNEAVLIHDRPLGFLPLWVEYAPEMGLRIMSRDGREMKTDVVVLPDFSEKISEINSILLVLAEGGKAVEGFSVSFIYQGV